MNFILVSVLFIIILLLLLQSFRYAVKDNTILTDIREANVPFTISKDTLMKSSSTSDVSTNFCYSVWIYVKDWNYNYGYYKPIFGRNDTPNDVITNIDALNDTLSEKEKLTMKPCPFVCLDKTENKVWFIMYYRNTNAQISYFKCDISNIPIQKWIQLTFSLYNKTLDIYLNGKLAKTCVMPNIVTISEQAGDISVCGLSGNSTTGSKAGFSGFISKLQYFPNALNPQDVWNMYTKGYGNLASSFSDYKLQFSLIENGNVINTLSI